ncbi:VOC family protein [Parasphingorhabdus pacifica]
MHFITLATPDLAAARAFYRDGLGWQPLLDVPDEIIFFQVGPGLVLGLFAAEKFRSDVDGAVTDTGTGGITLAHNVASPEEVEAVVSTAVQAGGRIVKPPQRAAFGGFHGHIADPNGVLWEICHNPGWDVDESGRVHLSQVES